VEEINGFALQGNVGKAAGGIPENRDTQRSEQAEAFQQAV
jgi:hypothetical protein